VPREKGPPARALERKGKSVEEEEEKKYIKKLPSPMGTARSPPIVPPHETVIKTLPPTVVSSAVAIRSIGLFLFLSL
jgi:archaellum component FlaD/FlaE